MTILTAINLDPEIKGFVVTPRVVELMHSLQDSELDLSPYEADGNTIADEPSVQLRDTDYGQTHLCLPLRDLIEEAIRTERDYVAPQEPFDEALERRDPVGEGASLRRWKSYRLLLRLQAAFAAWDLDERALDYDGAAARVAAEKGA